MPFGITFDTSSLPFALLVIPESSLSYLFFAYASNLSVKIARSSVRSMRYKFRAFLAAYRHMQYVDRRFCQALNALHRTPSKLV
jgi:hypothetical protein